MFSRIMDLNYSIIGILRYYTKYVRSCFIKSEKMKAYQFQKLRKLLITAYESIPFYREKYDQVGFNPKRDFKTLDDMKNVPILSKQEARQAGNALKNPKYKWPTVNFTTSGTTGHPFRTFASCRHWFVEQGLIYRHWKWAGYNFRDPVAIIRSYGPREDEPLIKADKFRNFYYFSPFHLTDKNLSAYVEKMKHLKVKFVRGYPSTILMLAQFMERHPELTIPTLEGAFVASEVLSAKDREAIETSLSVSVFNHYGLAEQVVMFGDCEEHGGLHNYEEYGYLELLEIKRSAHKRIIGTNLNNLAMPLIRYDTGDLAEVADEPCSCTRTSQSINNVIGRVDQAIQCQHGCHVPMINMHTMIEPYDDHVAEWQLIQHSLSSLELIVHTKDEVKLENVSGRMMVDFCEPLPQEIKVKLSVNVPFQQQSDGKKTIFVQNIH